MQSESAPAHSAQRASNSNPPPATTRVTSSLFDERYTLQRLVWRSAGATVYAAEHVFTRRPVAMKVLNDPAASVAIARMRREMEALALVRGAGVVDMLDAGETSGKPYIVFERLEGRTLAGLLAARGRLSADVVSQIGIEVAGVLKRCHDRGVIHRDLKPSNLFVTLGNPRRGETLGGEGRIKVLDFGIAKLSDSDQAAATKLTVENAILGTPEYMAPEALFMLPTADHRVDIYGLGVTLFECLTGSVPFEGQYADVLVKIAAKQVPSVRERAPDAPQGLCDVIQRCLSHSADDRFADMSEVVAALTAVLETRRGLLDLLQQPSNSREPRRDPNTLADAPISKSRNRPEARRKHPRAAYITLARVTLATGAAVDGRIEEVSEGGLQFIGNRAIESGSKVKIRFALPASGRVTEVSATARWHRAVRGNNACGVQFDEITESARDELRRYVEIVGRD